MGWSRQEVFKVWTEWHWAQGEEEGNTAGSRYTVDVQEKEEDDVKAASWASSS